MRLNHPFVVWGTCFLWIASMFAITWSIILFFSVGDMLMLTGMDIITALILLSGIIMFPTNIFMLYTIANGQRLSHKSRVLCCPLWILIIWIVAINSLGIFLCAEKIYTCNPVDFISHSMEHYRTEPRHKRFMDNLQWSLKCCGLESYKDWFKYDWYEKLRDYEWDPKHKKLSREDKKAMPVADSVPLSCCKSGICVPNYLLELGTHSINTRGCDKAVYKVFMTSMNFHLFIFFAIVITEIVILACIMSKNNNNNSDRGCTEGSENKKEFNVKHLMPVNDKFLESTSSASGLDEDYVEESEITN